MINFAHNSKKYTQRLSALSGLLVTLAITPVPTFAQQAIQTPDTEEQRRRAQEESQERKRALSQPKVELTPRAPIEPTKPVSLPEETPCFTLKRIVLIASPALPESTQAKAGSVQPLDRFYFANQYLQHYVGACVGKEGVSRIVQGVSNLILQEGYSTTRVGLQEQNLSEGDLTLTLVPGMIHDIRFSDPSLYGTWRNAFPTGPGHVLNLRDLEQGLEQMKKVVSQDVDMQIVPSDKAGESDIILNVRRNKPWRVSASFDNSGAKGTGELQASGMLSVDNPLGLSDIFNVGLNTSTERNRDQQGTNGQNLYYAIPFGYGYASLSASDYDYHQTVAGLNQAYVSSGKSKTLDFKVNYLFQRNQSQKNAVQVDIGKRWAHAFINDIELEVQKRNVTHFELGWAHTHYWGPVQLDLTLANRWGTSWFGGQTDAAHLPPDSPTYEYMLQTIDTTLSVPFSVGERPLTYIGTVRGQTTSSDLYLADQFSIGGRYTVRGFDGELTLTAERGFYMRNELDIPLLASADAITTFGSHSAYLGLDVGKVYGPSVQFLVGDKLAGAALGLRGAYKGVSYDVFSSWPVYRPADFVTRIPNIGFSVSVQY